MIFLNSDYDVAALADGRDYLVFTRDTLGAEKLRYSVHFGQNWTEWRDCEDILKSVFRDKKFFWKWNHVIMNCKLVRQF